MFVHLECHSHYSFLRGVNPPEEIIAAAVEQKMPAVALTDTNGMYAAIPFYQTARKAGVKPILGVVLDVERRVASGPSPGALPSKLGASRVNECRVASEEYGNSKSETRKTCSMPLVLLAMDADGYSNLCQLMTLRHLGALHLGQETFAEDASRPVTLQELATHSAGVMALWPAPALLQTDLARRGAACCAPTKAPASESGRYKSREKAPTPQNHPGREECASPTRSGQAPSGRHTISNDGLWIAGCESRVTNHESPATNFLAHLKSIFGDRLYLAVQHLSPGDGRTLREAEQLGREMNIPLVATNNVHFLKPEEHLHHRAVNAIRTGSLLTTVAPPEITTGEAWFKPAAEMHRLFPDHPQLLRATLEIAERCNLQLELGKLIFPEFPVPPGESPFSYLWKLSFEGARKRYRPLRPEMLARLTHELEVIDKLNLAPYFLLVWDIVEEANRRGIPAVARGSAASSMVTYCLGISCVCPLRWGLYFERFLNVQRGDCPDIDIDICGARRDELLDYVYARWGAEHVAEGRQGPHVAMIGSFITMHARLAVREIAKVFGVPPSEVNHFTKRLPHRPVREILDAIKHLPECRNLPIHDEPWKTILQVALRLDDAPRHLGIHPCGTVISARPLTHLVPLERAAKGIVVTQYDMNAIEALGLIKMDLLGQRGLTTMSLALDNIEKEVEEIKDVKEVKKKSGEPPSQPQPLSVIPSGEPAAVAGSQSRDPSSISNSLSISSTSSTSSTSSISSIAADGVTPCPKARTIDFAAIPENDPATCAVIAEGRTMGVFQIESPGMRGLLRTMKARTLEEMAAALALIRPGASEYGSKELFLKRLRGHEPVVYAHESLKSILGDTLGVCIYQEQVMQIAQAVGGMSLAEADLVRRSAAKFSGQRERERLRGKFLKAAEQMGLQGAEREETWMMVEKFAGFGFCKAHAATYADISYRMTYLKTHHTAEFLAAMCSADAGFYHVSAYVEEAKRWGIAVLLPSVNHSRMEYTAEWNADGEPFTPPLEAPFEAQGKRGKQGKRALRVGLMQVKGLRVETILAILRSREKHGAFHSLEDFLARIPAERDEIEALIKCGAFDGVCDLTRPAMLWQWNLLQAKGQHGHARPRAARFAALEDMEKADSSGTNRPRNDKLIGSLDNHAGASSSASPVLFAEMERDDSIAMALREIHTAEYTPEQKLRYEREILEVCVSGHPLDFLPRNGEAWSDELPQRTGKRVTLCGWMVTFRHVGTKNYRNMMFVTLEDQRGLYEVILFPEAYDKYGGLVYETRAMRVTGRVEEGGQVRAEALERLKV
jgi:DNA polymerase III alpha subunit